ncbi:MAG: hypothetical protein IJP85_06165 [Synergistaceae bacterium]|nr:hypothetical protein [Synergistaceae bacterium]
MLRLRFAVIFLILFVEIVETVETGYARAALVLDTEIISAASLKAGMSGHMLTVLKGTEPSKIPVKIISVVPQFRASNVDALILVELQGGVKLAQGMSGSPVYFDGKLAGAVRSGWESSDQRLALVTPITDMLKLKVKGYDMLADVSVSGISAAVPSMLELSRKLGLTFRQGTFSASSGVQAGRFKPGSAISVMLVWGDVEISALGTVTAVSKNGEFLALGHEFLKRGKVSYPSAEAVIYDIVNSSAFPFKLSTTTGINGTITQDRDAGLLGKTGYYAPSVSCKFVFRNLDDKTEKASYFRTVTDEFLAPDLIEKVCKGLCEELWDRKGHGTVSVTLRVDGKAVPEGWTSKDIFFSENDVITEAFKQTKMILEAFFTQPYSQVFPAGFTVTVEASENPRILTIEDIETVSEAEPGEQISVKVRLRQWRGDVFTKKFSLKIPEDSTGVVELIVRGGGTQPFEQAGINGGWKSVTSLERMLREFRASDGNNQLILELNADKAGQALREAMSGKNKRGKDLLPEEEEYLSETKERRIKEGTLKIYNSEYIVDGLMRRIIHTEK